MRTSPLAFRSFAVLLIAGATFLGGCHDATSPRSGSIRVEVVVSGVIDTTARFTLAVDGGALQTPLRHLQPVTVLDLSPGGHQLVLSNLTVNCSVAANPRSVEVSAGQQTFTQFIVTCVPMVGEVRVTTTSTGASLDPDGYELFLNHQDRDAIGVNDVLVLSAPVGGATVELRQVSRNCLVSPASAFVQVAFGATTNVHFDITCRAFGSLRVTTTTSGTDADPDGYGVLIASSGFAASTPIDINATKTIADLAPGDYTLSLQGVAANCDVTGTNPRALTVAEGAEAQMSFDVTCAAATLIAYSSDVTGDPEIYRVKSNGLGAARLTSSPHEDYFPSWSPDGKKIAFESWRDGHAEIYVMDADGAHVTRLTHDQGENFAPAWSPDGARIAFSSNRDGNKELYVMNTDGSNQSRLLALNGDDIQPAWSPDGQKIVFVNNGGTTDVYVLQLAGSVVTRLTQNVEVEQRPAWSPDGQLIAFSRPCDYYSTNCGLYTVRPDGTLPTRVYPSGAEPSWSPDGRRLAFTDGYCDYYYGCNLFLAIVKIDGTGYVSLVGTSAFQPAWRR